MRIFKTLSIAAIITLGFAWGGCQTAHAASLVHTFDNHNAAPSQVLEPNQSYYLVRIQDSNEIQRVYVFTRLDGNHDGYLSRWELPLDLVDLRLRFMDVDWDQDMRLSASEVHMFMNNTAPAYTPISHAMVALTD